MDDFDDKNTQSSDKSPPTDATTAHQMKSIFLKPISLRLTSKEAERYQRNKVEIIKDLQKCQN